MRPITSWLGGLAAVALLGGTLPAQAAGPIVIGETISETGALSVDAGYQVRGSQLAVAVANKHGGWLGRQIELKLYDDQSNSGTAVRLYTRLITQDNVNLLLGPYSSGVTKAVAPLINKYHMATIEPGASMPGIYDKSNHWNIQGTASSLQYMQQALPMAKEHGAKTAAVLGLKSAFSLACYHARIAQAKKLGIKVVYSATYSLPSPDFNGMALAIKNAHPDAVIGCTYYPDSVGITKALHDQGFVPKMLGMTIGPVEESFGKAVGKLAYGMVTNTSWWPTFDTKGNKQFIADYKAKYNQEPDYHAATGYSAVEALGAAVEATHSLNQTKIRNWLISHTVPTVQGTFHVNKHGLFVGRGQELAQNQDGVLKLLTPARLAQAKLEWPYPGK